MGEAEMRSDAKIFVAGFVLDGETVHNAFLDRSFTPKRSFRPMTTTGRRR